MKRLMLATALAAMAAACSDIPGSLSAGRTRVYLTDAPFPYDSIAEVNVYVARIDASTDGDTTGAGGSAWVTIATPQRAFNLLDLQGGNAALLGEADLPAAQYAAVRMIINTSRSSIVRKDGSIAPVQWPVADELALHALVEQPLAVSAGGAQIVIDFDVGRSFLRFAGGGPFVFIPVIRAVNGAATGEIRGSVTIDVPALILWSLENIALEVYREDSLSGSPLGYLAATARTDQAGHYVVPTLTSGMYRVTAYVPGYPWYIGSATTSVTAGATSTLNLVILSDSVNTGGGGGGGGGGTDTTTTPGEPSGPVTLVQMTPAAQTVHVGDSISILATPQNAQGQVLLNRTATWAISDSTVLTTTWSNAGWILFRAQKAGDVNVTATIEGVSATARVVVQ